MYWIRRLIGVWGEKRRVSMAAMVDHVELSSTHLVMGLKIDWRNETGHPISIKDIQMRIHQAGPGREPLRFYPLERFGRVLNKTRILKSPLDRSRFPPMKPTPNGCDFSARKLWTLRRAATPWMSN